jgi:hypothetical protein
MSRKILYGPEDTRTQLIKNINSDILVKKDPLVKNLAHEFDETSIQNQQHDLEQMMPVRLSLRFMASYKFFIYFLFFVFILNTLFSYSLPVSFMIVCSLLFLYTLYKY